MSPTRFPAWLRAAVLGVSSVLAVGLPGAPSGYAEPEHVRANSSAPSFTIQQVLVQGASAYKPELLRTLYEPLLSRPATEADIASVVSAITHYYRRGGYFLAAASVPKQRLDYGVLVVRVTEGTITGVRVEGDQGLYSDAIRKAAERLVGAQPVTQAAFDQVVQSLGSTPGVGVTVKVLPNPQHLGQFDLVLNLSRVTPPVVEASRKEAKPVAVKTAEAAAKPAPEAKPAAKPATVVAAEPARNPEQVKERREGLAEKREQAARKPEELAEKPAREPQRDVRNDMKTEVTRDEPRNDVAMKRDEPTPKQVRVAEKPALEPVVRTDKLVAQQIVTPSIGQQTASGLAPVQRGVPAPDLMLSPSRDEEAEKDPGLSKRVANRLASVIYPFYFPRGTGRENAFSLLEHGAGWYKRSEEQSMLPTALGLRLRNDQTRVGLEAGIPFDERVDSRGGRERDQDDQEVQFLFMVNHNF